MKDFGTIKPSEGYVLNVPRVYRVEVIIAATAYVKAGSMAEAVTKAAALRDTGIEVATNDGYDVPGLAISGLRYDDPDLPDVSLSPAMTIIGASARAEVV